MCLLNFYHDFTTLANNVKLVNKENTYYIFEISGGVSGNDYDNDVDYKHG